MSEAQTQLPQLVRTFADRYEIGEDQLFGVLTRTAFKQSGDKAISKAQMLQLLVVANQYKLNPFTKEIYAFPDKQNGIVPVVGVDGWSRIINQDPQFDGMEFSTSDDWVNIDEHAKKCPEYITCTMYRKDRGHPIAITEYLDEVYRAPMKSRYGNGFVMGPWQTHTKRFLRWKTMIQAARVAFGFVGIYDEDEGERIVGSGSVTQDAQGATVVQGEFTDDTGRPGCIAGAQAQTLSRIAFDNGLTVAPLLQELGVPDLSGIPAPKFTVALQRLNTMVDDKRNVEPEPAPEPAPEPQGDAQTAPVNDDFLAEYDEAEALGENP